jgi:hypothetical protein
LARSNREFQPVKALIHLFFHESHLPRDDAAAGILG